MLVATKIGTKRRPGPIDGWMFGEPTSEQLKLIALPSGPFGRKTVTLLATMLIAVYGLGIFIAPHLSRATVVVFVVGFVLLRILFARHDGLSDRRGELMDDPARVRSMRHLSFKVLRPDLAPSDAVEACSALIDEYLAKFAEIDAVSMDVSDELRERAEHAMVMAAKPLVRAMGYEDAWMLQRRSAVDDRLRRQHERMARDQEVQALLVLAEG